MELILYWLGLSQTRHYKKISYDGLNAFSIVNNYPREKLYIKKNVLNKFEEIDEENYIKRHNPQMNNVKEEPPNSEERSSEIMGDHLLKLQRKLIRGSTVTLQKKKVLAIGEKDIQELSPSPGRGKGKLFEYNYDLANYKPKHKRRISISTAKPRYQAPMKPKPEYSEIETVSIEPYNLYIIYIYIYIYFSYASDIEEHCINEELLFNIENFTKLSTSYRMFIYKWNLLKLRHIQRKFYILNQLKIGNI